MPNKGIFTASACVLFDRPASKSELAEVLSDFELVGESDGSDNWAFSGPTVVVNYRPEVNGLVAVDTVEHAWPDEMGNTDSESLIFAAWSMGHFGPFAYPQGLKRACEQAWAWPDGKQAIDRCRGFVRVRCSYIFGAEKDAATIPDDYDPIEEVKFVCKVAAELLKLPGAFCFFNPNGEVLRDRDTLLADLTYAEDHGSPPLELISNVRMFRVPGNWIVMDTVGNSQLNTAGDSVTDVEVAFPADLVDPQDVDPFLRNLTLYLIDNGPVFENGHTVDGPDGKPWIAHRREIGIMDPPRATIRFIPASVENVPPLLLADLQAQPQEE